MPMRGISVTYHGSQSEHHGPATLMDFTDQSGERRYDLDLPSGVRLSNVGAGSFTIAPHRPSNLSHHQFSQVHPLANPSDPDHVGLHPIMKPEAAPASDPNVFSSTGGGDPAAHANLKGIQAAVKPAGDRGAKRAAWKAKIETEG